MKKIGLLCLGVLCLLGITSCADNSTAESQAPSTAVPEVENVKVTFNTMGGSEIKAVEIKKGTKATKPSNPTKDGFVFKGWVTAENGTTEYNFDAVVNENLTLYASWEKKEAIITELIITTQPTKLSYVEGEFFDPAGMVVKAKYDDGTEKVITEYDFMEGIALSAGQEKAIISVGNVEAYIDITVTPKAISELKVKTNPAKTSYKCFESFNPEGMVLEVTYNNGSTEEVTEGFKYNKDQLLDCPQNVKVTFGGAEVLIPVTVEKVNFYGIPSQKEATYIDAKAIKDQLELSTAADKILADTTFGDIRIVNSEARYMAYEKVGTEFYREFRGHKFEGMMKWNGSSTVNGRWIEVNPSEDGTIYFWALTRADNQVLQMYENYTELSTEEDVIRTLKIEKDVEKLYSIPVYKGEKLCITTPANGFIYGLSLEYKPDYHAVSEMTLDTTNATLAFARGDVFNPGALKVNVKLDNNEIVQVRDFEYEIEPVDLSQAGEKTVTVKYQGLEATYKINVEELTGMKVTKLPTKTEYFAGETLDLAGIEVKVFTASGLEYILNEGYVADKTELKADDIVTLSYGELTCTLEIAVFANPIASISVKTNPTKTTYKTDEEFDPTGLVIEILYKSGEKAELTDLTKLTFDKTKLIDTDTVVKVSYDIFETEIAVKVIPTDYYVEDNTIYLDPTTIWDASLIAAEKANVKTTANVGPFTFESTGKAFQYESKSAEYQFEDHTYTGVFKAGGTTDFVSRYISVTPEKAATFRAMMNVASSVEAVTHVYLLDNNTTKPVFTDNTTYVQACDIKAKGEKSAVEFTLEAGKTYYFYFEGQTYVRGMYLTYGRIKDEIASLELNTEAVKKTFAVNDEFTYEGLVVNAKCVNDKVYALKDFVVEAPDMTTAGTKTVTVKFGKTMVATYEITVA